MTEIGGRAHGLAKGLNGYNEENFVGFPQNTTYFAERAVLTVTRIASRAGVTKIAC